VAFPVGDSASVYLETRYHYIWGPTVKNPTSGEEQKANGQFFPVTVGFVSRTCAARGARKEWAGGHDPPVALPGNHYVEKDDGYEAYDVLLLSVRARRGDRDGSGPDLRLEGEVITESAIIVAIDSTNRLITLKAEDGTSETIYAGPEVQRFAELKVGDKVTFKYYESVVYAVQKPGDTPPDPAKIGVVRARARSPARRCPRRSPPWC